MKSIYVIIFWVLFVIDANNNISDYLTLYMGGFGTFLRIVIFISGMYATFSTLNKLIK